MISNRKFFVIIIILLFFTKFTYLNLNENWYNDNQTIYKEEKFDSYIEAFNKAKDFIYLNLKGILINKRKIYLSSNPKVSVVIPCYNCKNYILKAISSIENQDFINFEIIIVNDNSNDTSLLFIEELQKEDLRIKLISNKKNMGTLYTRSIGTLSAKGKYIFPFDSDDMFLDRDILSKIIFITEKNNFDLVIFDIIKTNLLPNLYSPKLKIEKVNIDRKPNLVLFQPELGLHPIRPAKNNIKVVEMLIFARCVKTEIFKKALNKLGDERYSRYMHLVEDFIFNYIIFNTAKSMKYIPKSGYIYIQRNGSQSKRPKSNIQFLIYRIYLLDVLIEFSQDSYKHKKILVKLIFFCLENKNLKIVLTTNEYCNNLFISCLNRILNNKYISEDDKFGIRKRGKPLKFINYTF